MTVRQLLREAVATVRTSRVPSALVALLTAVMCASTLATVGRTVSAEREVQARMDAAGSKVIVLRDTQNKALLPPAVVDATAHLSVTDRAVGLSVPVDVVNGAIGPGSTPVPSWRVIGDLSAVATLEHGRWPRPGEALVSQPARSLLGLTDGYGWVTSGSEDVAVVGTFAARAPFDTLAGGVVIAATPSDVASSMHVVARTAADAQQVESLSISLVNAPSVQDLGIESPVSLAQLQQQVGRDLGSVSRSLVLGVLGGGALLTAIVVLADVLVRRKDLGRRRALGATRATIIALVMLRTAIPALLGAGVGAAVGLYLANTLNARPGATFAASIMVLSTLAAISSSAVPAMYAAHRDPVEVLRTP